MREAQKMVIATVEGDVDNDPTGTDGVPEKERGRTNETSPTMAVRLTCETDAAIEVIVILQFSRSGLQRFDSRRCRALVRRCFRLKFEEVARLAAECGTDRIER